MVLPDLPPGIWIGIGFGVVGISLWVIGLFVFDRLVDKMQEKEEGPREP